MKQRQRFNIELLLSRGFMEKRSIAIGVPLHLREYALYTKLIDLEDILASLLLCSGLLMLANDDW
jgi:hypothetical protein